MSELLGGGVEGLDDIGPSVWGVDASARRTPPADDAREAAALVLVVPDETGRAPAQLGDDA